METEERPIDLIPPAAGNSRARSMANAAEQAVLRRVAPALKHDMVVHLQAAAMLAEMLNARVERGLLNPQDLQANLGKLNRLAREAVAGCLKVINWIDCPPEESVAVHEGVRECAGLLAASFNFRGFTIVDDVASTEFEVGRRALRHLLAASLLTLADEARDTGELVIESEIGASHAVVSVRWQARPRDPDSTIPPASGTAPRQLVDWSEVQALAAAEGTEVTRTPERIAIRLPRAVVTSPLQMAPV